MVVNYQDKNLIVTYLQIYLAEYSGLTLQYIVPRSKRKEPYYEITNNNPLVVTGYYNTQTYGALALYMAYNYPNEGFPMKWSKNNKDQWVSEDYVYTGDSTELIGIIQNNIEAVPQNKQVIQIPERVLSYIFEEVVTPLSPPEEVLRVKQLMYSFIYADAKHPHPLTYTDELSLDIITIQQSIIDKYTLQYETLTDEIVMQEDTSGSPILTYQIKPRLSKVTAVSDNSIPGGSCTISGNSVKVNLVASKILSATAIYEVDGQSFDQEAIAFEKLNNKQWSIMFAEPLDNLNQVNITCEEVFVYNTITGDITFEIFEENKKIILTELYNKVVSYPENLLGYKVTGYVDPWTEVIIKKGYEERDGSSTT